MSNLSRSQFNALPPRKRMDIILGGECIVVDDPPRARMKMPAGSISRTAFDAMPPAERLATVRAGKQIFDDGDLAHDAAQSPGEGFAPAPGGIGWVKA